MNLSQPKEFDPTVVQATDALTVTASALQHIENELEKRGYGIGVRINLDKKGCSGFAYVVDFVDEITAEDVAFPITDALSILVRAKYFPFLKGTCVDYVREGMNARFKFINPNEKGACGCGESFTL